MYCVIHLRWERGSINIAYLLEQKHQKVENGSLSGHIDHAGTTPAEELGWKPVLKSTAHIPLKHFTPDWLELLMAFCYVEMTCM